MQKYIFYKPNTISIKIPFSLKKTLFRFFYSTTQTIFTLFGKYSNYLKSELNFLFSTNIIKISVLLGVVTFMFYNINQ